AVPDQFHRGRTGEVEQSGFGRAVGDVAGLALMTGRRDDVDDGAARAALDHQLRDMLGKQERPTEDDADLPLPFRKGHVDDALLVEYGGTVYQDVDCPECRDRGGDG